MWCGALTLKEVFLGLDNIAIVKDASIAANMDFTSGSLQWNVSRIWLVHNWEREVLASFYTLWHSHRMRRDGEDKIWWVPSSEGKFDVRSFYNILAIKEASSFPWKIIWHAKSPSRVNFFIWRTVFGKIITIDNLRKRNFIVINRYYLCKFDGESIDHLLLHCEIVCSLWHAIFSWFGLSWVMPCSVAGLLDCWWLGFVFRVLLCRKWFLFASCGAYD